MSSNDEDKEVPKEIPKAVIAEYLKELKARENSILAKEVAAATPQLSKTRRGFHRVIHCAGQCMIWGTLIMFTTVQSASLLQMLYPLKELEFKYDGWGAWDANEVISLWD